MNERILVCLNCLVKWVFVSMATKFATIKKLYSLTHLQFYKNVYAYIGGKKYTVYLSLESEVT